ncbi:MAG TPA: cation-transporting P-type ATPase [Chryseolinea sp.]
MDQGIKYYTLDVNAVVESLKTDPTKGLAETEVRKRLDEHGQNVVDEKKQVSAFTILLRQFSNPIVWILIVAALVAFSFNHSLEGIAVTIVIAINTLIGFFMERQALRSMEKLRTMAATKAKVLRNGKIEEIDSAMIVPGDILHVQEGDVVTADARILEHNRLAVKEAALTGESIQVDKTTERLNEDVGIADQKNMVFKGTIVSRGSAKMVVTSTGGGTELGKIAHMTGEAKKVATPLNKKLRTLTKKLIWLTLVLAVAIFVSGVIRGEDLTIIIETAIALAIACIPEGLPVISSVTLGKGMLRLADHNVIVKTLESVQTLGETEVIFTDKTGTLTENEMYVQSVVTGDGSEVNISDPANHDALKKNPDYPMLLTIAVLCNSATFKKKEGGEANKSGKEESKGDPIEVALLRMAAALSEDSDSIKKKHPRKSETPFDAEIKMMSTVNASGNGFLVCVKGAAEEILNKCTKIQEKGEVKDFADKEKWKNKTEELANKGQRVLGFAFQNNDKPDEKDVINDLIFIGLIGFIDPPRKDIKESIQHCRNAGIKVVMVTGDHPGTAAAIAKEVGLDVNSGQVYHGRDLKSNPSKDDKQKMLNATVFSRVDPGQKLNLVTAFQEKKIVVAMTGDGVNDAPALKKSDIGIAMGIRGTEAAKEAADIILKDDAFPSIVEAVKYGRLIFDNIRTFIVYLLSCNLSEILIVTIASFLNLPLPLLPLQILFINMITDTFPALAIGMGEGDEDVVMKRKPRRSSVPIVSNTDWVSIVIYSLCLTAGVIGVEFYALHILRTDEAIANNITFYTLIMAQLWHVFNMSSRETSFFRNQITENKYIWMALLLCIGMTVAAYVIPPSQSALSLVPMEWIHIGIIMIASMLPVVLIQLLKRLFKISQ